MKRNWMLSVVWALTAATVVGQDETAEWLSSLELLIQRGRLSSEDRLDLRDFLTEEDTGSVRGRLLLGRDAIRRGRYQDAAEVLAEVTLEQAIARGLGSQWVCCQVDLDRLTGRTQQARELLTGAVEKLPGDAEILARLIEVMASTGARDDTPPWIRQMPKVSSSHDGDPLLQLAFARVSNALGDVARANRYAVVAELTLRKAGDARQSIALRIIADTYRRVRDEDGVSALRTYEEAIAIDSLDVLSHVGIGRTYLDRLAFDKARPWFEKALGIQPDHPEARAARAELTLYERHFSEALKDVDDALATCPDSPELLACRAVALDLLGRQDEAKEVEERVAASGQADAVRRIGELISFHYRFEEAIPRFLRAIELQPTLGSSFVGLARCYANTGQTEKAIEALADFRRRDPFHASYKLAGNLGKALGSLDRTIDNESGNFTFLLDPLDNPVLGPIYKRLLHPKWKDFMERYGVGLRNVRFEVYADHDDFSARTVGFTGFGALGVCFGDVVTLVSPSSQLRGSFHFERTAVHELAHVVSLALSNQRVPRWMTEGMSVYEEKRFSPICDRDMDLDLFNYYHSGEITPLAELNQLFGSSKIIFGYFQGGLICEFLVGRFGEDVLAKMLRLYADDRETPDVLEAVTGMTTPDFDVQFLEWIWDTRLKDMRVQPIYTPDGLKRLRREVQRNRKPTAQQLAQLAWAYHQHGREVDRDDYLGRALRLDPDHGPALMLAAERSREAGRPELTMKYLTAGLADTPEFFGFIRLAEQRLTNDDVEGALSSLAQARDCFPRYVGAGNPYLQRARLFQENGREEEAVNELRAYCAIAEADIGPRQLLVDAALSRGDHAEARRYLLELRAIDPFQSQLFRDLARCERALARSGDAIEALEMALVIDPSLDPLYNGIGEEGRAQQLRESHAEIHLDLTEIYLELGRRNEARTSWERALTLNETAPRVEELRDQLDG